MGKSSHPEGALKSEVWNDERSLHIPDPQWDSDGGVSLSHRL